MCQFFSLVSDGKGKPYYFDWKIRKKIFDGKLNYEPDSHTSIADYFGFKAEKEDKLNKYEYNPLTKALTIDQINTTDDSNKILKFCEELDFKIIVPKLIIKPIVNPFKDRSITKVTQLDIKLLKKFLLKPHPIYHKHLQQCVSSLPFLVQNKKNILEYNPLL